MILVFKGIFEPAILREFLTIISCIPETSYNIFPGFITATQYSTLPLPEPIRVSAARKVTGLSGKILIQSFPPRRENLVITRLVNYENFLILKME